MPKNLNEIVHSYVHEFGVWILGFRHFTVLSLSGISPRTLSWTPLWGSFTYRLETIRWPITFRLSVSAGWASRFLYSVRWYTRLPDPAGRTSRLLNSVRWSRSIFLTLLWILESSDEFFCFPDTSVQSRCRAESCLLASARRTLMFSGRLTLIRIAKDEKDHTVFRGLML